VPIRRVHIQIRASLSLTAGLLLFFAVVVLADP
jgi:hypothetical protein